MMMIEKCNIDEYGSIYVKRHGEFKKQFCSHRDSEWGCGDQCPAWNLEFGVVTLNCFPQEVFFVVEDDKRK